MQKQQFIGIIVITAILMFYMTVIWPKYYPAAKPTPKQTVAVDTTKNIIVTQSTTKTVSTEAVSLDTTILVKAQEIVVESDLYQAKFNTLGGRLTSFRLKQVAVEKFSDISTLTQELNTARQKGDEMQSDLLEAEINKINDQANYRRKEQQAKDQKNDVLAKEYADKAKELEWVELVNSDGNQNKPLELSYAGNQESDKTILYSASTNYIQLDAKTKGADLILTGTLKNGLVVKKIISLTDDNYILKLNIALSNPTDKILQLSNNGVGLQIHGGTGIGDLQMRTQSRYETGVQPMVKVNNKVTMVSSKYPESRLNGDVEWAAIETNYFFKGFVPTTNLSTTVVVQYIPMGKLLIPTFWLETQSIDIAPKAEANYKLQFYIGPKQSEKLAPLNVPIEDILFYHPWFGFLKTIDLWILIILKWLYSLAKNYGVAVILISVLFKIVTFPLTHMSFKSMKGMQMLAPEIKVLQDKYKDDPTRLQKETMGLYKKHGVNPMTGCLPMLIQMPIFISLYAVLGKAIELRGAPFIWWITDLSKPDTIAYIAGFPLNILPILMGATMWLQQKMSTTPDPKNAMMSQMMTIFFLFIFWSMPSGLVLYWFISNILSILQQHYVNKQAIPVHLPHPHEQQPVK